MKNKKIRSFGKWPITARVTLWYTFFIALIFIALIGASIAWSEELVDKQSQDELVKKTKEMAAEMDDFEPFDDGIYFAVVQKAATGTGTGSAESSTSGSNSSEESHHMGKHNSSGVGGTASGNMYAMSSSINMGKLEISDQQVTKVHHKDQDYLYYDVPLGGRQWLRGIMPVSKSMQNLKVLIIVLCLVSPLVILFLAFGGYKIMKKAFRPVQALTETAEDIERSGDFSKRLYVGDTKDEISDMAVVLNKMLESLETHYMKEKQFSNDVSHELRTPIAVILAESEYGIRYSQDPETKESFEVIARQSRRMRDMIQSILELSRLGRTEYAVKEHLDFSELLTQMADDYDQLCEEKGIRLEQAIEPAIYADTNRILCQRLIENLISNAMKFTDDWIKISLEKENERTVFSVRDNGPGISDEDMEKIWDKFYQVDQSRNRKSNKGIGLGLSFVKEIAAQNGWELAIDSRPGEGSCFKVYLS